MSDIDELEARLRELGVHRVMIAFHDDGLSGHLIAGGREVNHVPELRFGRGCGKFGKLFPKPETLRDFFASLTREPKASR